jgi:hypothetical protein
MNLTSAGIALSGLMCSGIVRAEVVPIGSILELEILGFDDRERHATEAFGWGTDFALFITDGFSDIAQSIYADDEAALETMLAELCSFAQESCAESTGVAPIRVFDGLDSDELTIGRMFGGSVDSSSDALRDSK